MHKVKQNLLISAALVVLAGTALITRGYENISGYLFYVWFVGLFVGVVMLTSSLVKLLKQRDPK